MKSGLTLIEVMLVVLIFTFLLASTLAVLATSDRSWREGHDKLTEQQQARRAMDGMVRLLRQSNPAWEYEGTYWSVAITSGTRIDFYQPVFDEAGEISTLRKITFKLNPADPSQLLKKEGTQDEVAIANKVASINFGGGCSACSAFNCSSVADDCPVVKIDIQTQESAGFTLSSEAVLRNTNIALEEEVEVEEPEEGEF